jgi:hypothetical protein
VIRFILIFFAKVFKIMVKGTIHTKVYMGHFRVSVVAPSILQCREVKEKWSRILQCLNI